MQKLLDKVRRSEQNSKREGEEELGKVRQKRPPKRRVYPTIEYIEYNVAKELRQTRHKAWRARSKADKSAPELLIPKLSFSEFRSGTSSQLWLFPNSGRLLDNFQPGVRVVFLICNVGGYVLRGSINVGNRPAIQNWAGYLEEDWGGGRGVMQQVCDSVMSIYFSQCQGFVGMIKTGGFRA